MANPPPESKPDLFVVSVSDRIPDFWTDQPALWFIQFEAVVVPQKQSDDNQYQLLIAKLGKSVLQQVTDIITAPPSTEKYKTLKARLLNVYEESENQRIQKLISSMQLGDQKPSQLLRKMKTLAGSRMTDETLAILWKNHLPSAVRAVLAASELKDVTKLAAVADKVLENVQIQPEGVAEVCGPNSSTGSLADQVAKLNLEIAELRRAGQRRGDRGRSNSRSRGFRNRSRSRGPRRTPKDADWLCFYHFRFKDKATKCVTPCNWKGEKPVN